MGIEALLETLRRRDGADPSATRNPMQPHATRPGLQENSRQIKPVSLVSPATPQNGNADAREAAPLRSDARRAWRALVGMPDGDPRPARWLTLLFPTDTTEAEARAAAQWRFPGRVVEVRA